MNQKFHATGMLFNANALENALILLLSESQMSDFKSVALMLDPLPKAKALLGDKGNDADWFRAALPDRGITACIY